MKTLNLFLAMLSIFLFSCTSQNENKNTTGFGHDSTHGKGNNHNEPLDDNNAPETLRGYTIMSQKFGMAYAIMPIPDSWQVVKNLKENIIFQSNKGVKVYGEYFAQHFFSNNQQLNHLRQQSGFSIKPPKGANLVIMEDITPNAGKLGLHLVNQFPLPELNQTETQLNGLMFKSVPESKQFQCIATEWEDNKSNKHLCVLRYFITHYPTVNGVDWGYTINTMEAPKAEYEQAKKAYINAMVNLKINPEWLKANNSYYAQLSKQNSINHQQNMYAINARGQAALNNGNTYSSILDSNHESWKRRNALNDAGHSNSVNSGIWERTSISNPNSGQHYWVGGQNNYYWANNNNEYIGTDTPFYDPRANPDINHENWTPYNIKN
ncbi:MAG: hypothetical protein ACK5NB_04880 [Flavobacteriaceae bacterium]